MKTELSQKNTLLVDNSNTRTKFMLARGRELLPGQRMLPTAELSSRAVRALLQGWDYGRAALCSVVPAARSSIIAGLGMEPLLLGADSPMNILLDYPLPATLGADRLANAMAAAERCPLPCVAIDLGTASTFDVLVEGEGRPRFIGGVIAPGLAAMGQYLGRNTALLPALEAREPQNAIGRSTAEALHAGAWHGYRGLVREILRSIAAELGRQPCVIATGGDAALLASALPEICAVDPFLTFRGIALAARQAGR